MATTKRQASLDTTARTKPALKEYTAIFPANLVRDLFDRSSSAAYAASLVLSMLMMLFISYGFAVVYGGSKAVFDPLIADFPLLEGVAPLVYGLVRALTYGSAVYLSYWATGGGLIGCWDTVVFALYGFINRGAAKKQQLDAMDYAWNLLLGTGYLCAQLLGSYIGGLTVKFLVPSSAELGGAVYEHLLHSHPNRALVAFMLITGLWIFAKLYTDNPFVGPQPHGAQINTYVVAAVGVFGGYLGTTGAFDLMAPLGLALASGLRFGDFWTLFVGQMLGALLGVLAFVVVIVQHAVQLRASDNTIKGALRAAASDM